MNRWTNRQIVALLVAFLLMLGLCVWAYPTL